MTFVVLIASFLLRSVAWGWSLWLMRRLRDWRIAVVSLLAAIAWVDSAAVLLTFGAEDAAIRPWPELITSLLVLVGLAAIAHASEVGHAMENAEATDQASEERFSKIFRACPDAIILSSFPQGRILDVNEGFTATTGYTLEQARGRTSQELGLWSDPEGRTRMGEALESLGTVQNLESEFRDQAGKTHTCLISADVIELEGKPSVLTILRDVSERKRVEREREQLITELETKNAELERFSYTVSHDLKTPLVTIRGFLGLLERDAANGDIDRMRRDASRIRAATEIMGQLLDELLELSRIGRQVNPPEAVPLTDLAREAVELIAPALVERGVEVHISSALPVVVGDRPRLLEVLQNLIENAVKYMGEQTAPRVEVSMQNGDQTVFYVRDNGIGIDPRYHEKVFGLFERLSSDQAGTGVGLALVKRIVEVHGGHIWVESEGLDQGSTFFFTLPSQVQEPLDAAKKTAPPTRSRYGQGRPNGISVRSNPVSELES